MALYFLPLVQAINAYKVRRPFDQRCWDCIYFSDSLHARNLVKSECDCYSSGQNANKCLKTQPVIKLFSLWHDWCYF